MNSAQECVDSELMPDWHRRKGDPIDRFDWDQILELGSGRDLAPRAAQVEEACY